MNDSIDGMPFTVVEEGSADDPLYLRPAASSTPAAASPATSQPGTATVAGIEGQVQPVAPTQPQVATPAPATPAGTESTPEAQSPLQLAIQNGNLDEYVAGLLKPQLEAARRELQSSADKRINTLQEQLKEAREAEIRREREGKLANEDLTDEEKELLRNKWELEDQKTQLAADFQVAEDFYRKLYVAELAQANSQFGVTAEQLEQFEEPEQMDAFVTTAELEFYKSGKHLTAQVPSNAVVATPTGSAPAAPTAPAGATAPSDIGGGAPAAPNVELETGFGKDVMARNLNKSEWVLVPLPN